MDQKQLKSAEKFFPTPEVLKAFALVCLDGTNQQTVLGITRQHYADQTVAASWYRAIRAELARCRHHLPKKEYSAANDAAGKLFESMTKPVR